MLSGSQSTLRPPRRGIMARLQERAEFTRAQGPRRARMGFRSGQDNAQGPLGTERVAWGGEVVCDLFSWSTGCGGPTSPRPLLLVFQLFHVLLHPGIAVVGTNVSPTFGEEAAEQEG